MGAGQGVDLDTPQSVLHGLRSVHHVCDLAVGALLRQVHQHAVVVLVQSAQVQPVPALHAPMLSSASSSQDAEPTHLQVLYA